MKWLLALALSLTVGYAVASEGSRFGISDLTQVGGVGGVAIWLVHDAAHVSQCLLMVKTPNGMTATPWSCQ